MTLHIGRVYDITKQIKIHTKPLVEVCITLRGQFIKETDKQLFFDSFKVNKNNVIKVKEI